MIDLDLAALWEQLTDPERAAANALVRVHAFDDPERVGTIQHEHLTKHSDSMSEKAIQYAKLRITHDPGLGQPFVDRLRMFFVDKAPGVIYEIPIKKKD